MKIKSTPLLSWPTIFFFSIFLCISLYSEIKKNDEGENWFLLPHASSTSERPASKMIELLGQPSLGEDALNQLLEWAEAKNQSNIKTIKEQKHRLQKSLCDIEMTERRVMLLQWREKGKKQYAIWEKLQRQYKRTILFFLNERRRALRKSGYLKIDLADTPYFRLVLNRFKIYLDTQMSFQKNVYKEWQDYFDFLSNENAQKDFCSHSDVQNREKEYTPPDMRVLALSLYRFVKFLSIEERQILMKKFY